MRPLLFLAGLLLATTTAAHAAPPLAASPEAWVPAGFVVKETGTSKNHRFHPVPGGVCWQFSILPIF